MNIKDKIEEIRLKACDDFGQRTKSTKYFCIWGYRLSEEYKYWKGRVGSTMHLSRAEECIEHMETMATHDFDFNTAYLIDKLFEAGLVKDELNQECYDYEMPLESVRSFILNELNLLHGIVGKIVDDKDCVIRANINNIHTNIDAYIKRMQKHIEEELLK